MDNHGGNNHHQNQQLLSPPVANGGSGGREDCWSESATEILFEVWSERYLQLNRGNLRQKDWKEVADAVNGRQNGLKPKTDIQCKNRIDTLKRKYKMERAKSVPSKWTLFYRLERIIGTSNTPASKINLLSSGHKTPNVTFTVKSKEKPVIHPNLMLLSSSNPNVGAYSGGSSSRSRVNSAESTESSRDGGNDNHLMFDGAIIKQRLEEDSSVSGLGELARAILKFGEIYERIENVKQQKMMELERKRMEFAKDLEFQKMQMFMEAQLELEKMKSSKYASGSGNTQNDFSSHLISSL